MWNIILLLLNQILLLFINKKILNCILQKLETYHWYGCCSNCGLIQAPPRSICLIQNCCILNKFYKNHKQLSFYTKHKQCQNAHKQHFTTENKIDSVSQQNFCINRTTIDFWLLKIATITFYLFKQPNYTKQNTHTQLLLHLYKQKQ